MPALRILIAQTRSDILALALAEAVRSDASLSLCAGGVIDEAGIEDHLLEAETRPDVLILIGEASLLEERSRLFATLPEALVVIRLDVRDQLGHIDFRHVPLEGLMDILRAIAVRPESARLGDTASLTAPQPTGVPLLPLQPSVAPSRVQDAPQLPQTLDHDPLLVLATRWLDALIRNHLAQRVSHQGDVPGFGVSHATIEQAAQGAALQADPELAAQLDAAGHALQDALDQGGTAPLGVLISRLRLTEFEWRTVLLCLAPELEHRYQRIFGYLHDDLSRRAPSVTLASALLGEPLAVRRHLVLQGRLQQWKLLRAGDSSVLGADDVLRIDAPVVAWLLGSSQALLADPRLERIVRSIPWPGRTLLTSSADTGLAQRIADLLGRTTARSDWLLLTGEDLAGWRGLLEVAAELAQRTLLRVRLSALLECSAEEREEAITRAVRAASLTDAVLAVDHDAEVAADAAAEACLRALSRATRTLGRVGFLLTARSAVGIQAFEGAGCRLLVRQASDLRSRERMLLVAAQQAGLTLRPPDARRIAGLYAFDVEGIYRSVQLARTQTGEERGPERAARAVLRACRSIGSVNLPNFARRIEPVFDLDDVVLPTDKQAQLRELVSQVHHADVVLETWGFKQQLPYGRGVAALFSGPSGTGKTMAAQAIARALDTELYIVDLARIVSKYIGDTEKNLDAAFNDAERASAVLLFDEADALFGKRSDVKDSHDRYANIEVAYLLQRMESYSGVAILTTNRRQNLDAAFLRRLRFIVEFPKPDAAARERIWQQCLQSDAPRAADLDLGFLARRVDVTGGNIRQITLNAAFAAAAEGSPIAMRHAVAATRAELRKLGRTDVDLEAAA